MKSKLLFLIVLTLILVNLAGCWDYAEYESLALVFGVGIDYHPETDRVTFTIQYLEPSRTMGGAGGGGGTQPGGAAGGAVSSVTDITIADAVNTLQQVVSKRLFFAYMNVLVIDQEAARFLLKDVIELADRTPAIRTTANFVVTPGQAKEVITAFNSATMEFSGRVVNDLVNLAAYSGASYPVSIQDFEEMLAISGINAVAPRIVTIDEVKPEEQGQQGQSKQAGASPGSSVPTQTKTTQEQREIEVNIQKPGSLRVKGLAVFREGKLVGWLDQRESRSWGWITGKKVLTYVSVHPTGPNNTKNIMNFIITSSRSKIKAKLVDGQPTIQVNLKVEASLRKFTSNQGATVLTPKVVKQMEKQLAEHLHSELETAVRKGQQELRTDVFKFGFAFFKRYPRLWRIKYQKIWPEIYPDVPVSIRVKVRVINTGNNVQEFKIE